MCAFAQQVEIRECFTNDFIPSNSVAERHYWIDDNAVGVQSMYFGEYCDSLVRYFLHQKCLEHQFAPPLAPPKAVVNRTFLRFFGK